MTMRIENPGDGAFTFLRFSKAEKILPNGIHHIDGNRIMDELLDKTVVAGKSIETETARDRKYSVQPSLVTEKNMFGP